MPKATIYYHDIGDYLTREQKPCKYLLVPNDKVQTNLMFGFVMGGAE